MSHGTNYVSRSLRRNQLSATDREEMRNMHFLFNLETTTGVRYATRITNFTAAQDLYPYHLSNVIKG